MNKGLKLIGLKEIRTYMGLSEPTVIKLMKQGTFPYYRMGRKLYAFAEEIDEALKFKESIKTEKKEERITYRERSKEGGEYYYIGIMKTTDKRCGIDDICFSCGNYFLTREEAIETAEKIKAVLQLKSNPNG